MSAYYHQHQKLLEEIIKAIQKRFSNDVKLFPVHVGLLYTKRGTPMRVGIKGQADMNGWVKVCGIPIRLEIEVKSGKSGIKKKSDQHRWQEMCKDNNVIHIEARSVDQTIEDLITAIDNVQKLIKSI